MYAEPKSVKEIEGGRYDGAHRVDATCPHCGEPVSHILEGEDYGSHRVADCRNRCRGGYTVVRPKPGLLPGFWRAWWKGTPQTMGLNANMGLPLPEDHPDRDTKPRGPGLLGRFFGRDG